jgi:hypothetical protein
MNKALEKFLTFIVSADSIEDINGYIASRKINDDNLNLQMGYLNGSAYIMGVAYDKFIKVRYNYFQNEHGFLVTHDGKEMALSMTMMNLCVFFNKGKFLLGTQYKDGTFPEFDKRIPTEMNWYLWEAVCTDLGTLQTLKLAPQDLVAEASSISETTRDTKHFTLDLRSRACEVEYAVEKFRKELEAHYGEEDKIRIQR